MKMRKAPHVSALSPIGAPAVFCHPVVQPALLIPFHFNDDDNDNIKIMVMV